MLLIWINDDAFYKPKQKSDAESDNNENDLSVFHKVSSTSSYPVFFEKGWDYSCYDSSGRQKEWKSADRR
jgi:hypothetical protein